MKKYIVAIATTVDGADQITVSDNAYDNIDDARTELKHCYDKDLAAISEWDSEPDYEISKDNEWYYFTTRDGKVFAEIKTLNV